MLIRFHLLLSTKKEEISVYLIKDVEMPFLPVPGMTLYLGPKENSEDFQIDENLYGCWCEDLNELTLYLYKEKFETLKDLNETKKRYIEKIGFKLNEPEV